MLPTRHQLPSIHNARNALKDEVSQKALSVLMPEESYLRRIDAQRSIQILDRLINKVIFVSTIPIIMKNIDLYELLLGSECVKLFKQYIPVVKEYEDTLKTSNISILLQLEEDSSKRDYFENVIGINPNRKGELRDTVVELIRKILRNLLQNDVVQKSFTNHCREWNVQVDEPIKGLGKRLVQLRFLVIRDLLSTANEQTARDSFIKGEKMRYNQYTEETTKLRNELANMYMKQNESIKEIPGEMNYLRDKICELEKKTIVDIQDLGKSHLHNYTSNAKKFKLKLKMLEAELKSERKKLQETCSVNQSNERDCRLQKMKIEELLFDTHSTMDTKMMDLQIEITSITERLDEVCKKFDILHKDYEPLKVEYDKIMTERERIRQEKEDAEAERLVNIKAATVLQSYWRSFKERKRLRTSFRKNAKLGIV